MIVDGEQVVVLLVMNDALTLRYLGDRLRAERFQVFTAGTVAAAQTMLKAEPLIVVADLALPDGCGLAFLRKTLSQETVRERILLCDRAEVDRALPPLTGGVISRIMTKPLVPPRFERTLRGMAAHAAHRLAVV